MVKFFRGLKANYAGGVGETHRDGLYFATDTHELLMNGVAYGINNDSNLSGIDARLDVLEGDSSTQGSVAYQIAQIVAGADASYDTLKEIADWILSDTTGAAKMASDISTLSSGKADKVTSATNGNFAGLNANGNLTDSGYSNASFDAFGSATAAESAAKTYADGLIAGLDATKSQTAGADGLALSITETDGKITAISGSIAANTYDAYGSASTAESNANTYADSLIAGLDATKSQTAGADGLALSITETDGKITAISGSIAANTYDAYGSASTAENNAKTYADGLLAWNEVVSA